MAPGKQATSSSLAKAVEPLVVGRYVLSAELARGGMATVYVGRLHGDGGFKRVVAVKRLHAHFRSDDNLSTMFLDEARLAARIRHPNVVHAVDVALHDGEMFIVMEYVEGASLSQLMRASGRRAEQIPFAVASAVVCGLLQGLHAAHDAHDEKGQPLGIVHRDVSPQNVIVGTDGVARVLDFGVAKAVGQAHVTREGEIKGKLAYMAPEQLLGSNIQRQADVFAAGTILWELLTGRRLFYGENDGEIVRRVLDLPIPAPSSINEGLTPAVDSIVLRALERDPARRFATAGEMAAALEDAILPGSTRQIGAWVRSLEGEALMRRSVLVAEIESGAGVTPTTSATDLVTDRERSSLRRRPSGMQRYLMVAVGALALVGIGWGASRLSATPQRGAAVQAEVVSPNVAAPPSAATPSAVASELPVTPSTSTLVGAASASAATSSAPPATASSALRGAPTASPISAAAASVKGKPVGRTAAPAGSVPQKPSIYSRD